jgi:hypothetical protein
LRNTLFARLFQKTYPDIDAGDFRTGTHRALAEITSTAACVQKSKPLEVLSGEKLIEDHFEPALQVVVIHDVVEI